MRVIPLVLKLTYCCHANYVNEYTIGVDLHVIRRHLWRTKYLLLQWLQSFIRTYARLVGLVV
jgi:hypothetical protein